MNHVPFLPFRISTALNPHLHPRPPSLPPMNCILHISENVLTFDTMMLETYVIHRPIKLYETELPNIQMHIRVLLFPTFWSGGWG